MKHFFTLVLIFACTNSAFSETDTDQQGVAALPIPKNIETYNVPPLNTQLGARLNQYANTRSAFVYGWQDDTLLIGTRFSETTQMHRVKQPLGYRQQLTFLPEPLAGAAIPKSGAKDKILISWDEGGSEFDQLFLFDVNTGTSSMVSDGKSLYGAMQWASDEQSFIYVTTERNGRNWDIHQQDLMGNKKVLLETEQGYWYPVDWSADGERLLVKHRVSINESSIYELVIATGELTKLVGAAPGESVSIGHASYDNEDGVYYTSDADSEFLRLHRLELATGKIQVITKDVQWNVEGFVLSPDYKYLAYSVNEEGFSKLTVLNLYNNRPVRLNNPPQGIMTGFAFSPDSKKLALSINTPISPTDVYVIDIRRSKTTRWTQSEVGGMDTNKFVDAELFRYSSFDKRSIPAFIFKPDTPGPHPVVVLIHGGPEAQYRPYFSTTVQSYVNEMNVAVIAPNVRGSNGYGKSYLQLDNGFKREDSVQDIGALLDWIGQQDDLRADRVAVTGGSYGGYMVLASMVHFGDKLAAAVESVGISNFVTFLENTQPYRQDMRRVEYGDERDPKMRAHLEKISPLNHVDKMRTPLLISQGANDPRVPASESEQIRQALDEAGVSAWYILARDEGHGFRKKTNRDYDRAAKFAFLEHYLSQE